MRFRRLISFMAAFALLGFLPFVASTPAAAVAPSGAATAADSGLSVSARADRAANRAVGAKIVKKRGKLIMQGRVKNVKGPVTIQKATKCNQKTKVCNFQGYKKVRVKNNRYSLQVPAPARGNFYWRARAGNTVSSIWRTYKM